MGNILYLDCKSGISGDMFAAAMLDLGADQEKLEKILEALPVKGFRTVVTRVDKNGLDACDFNVLLDSWHENHDHDMTYLHKGGKHEDCEKMQGHHHEKRRMEDIRNLIEQAEMSENAKQLALRIFEILADAEAKAHGVSAEQVHFHEVGAVDSIADILAAAICVDDLGITEVIVPQLYDGQGTVRCQHGILSIPVPAVSNIVSAYGIKLHITDVEGELVTPTGAAIAAALKTTENLPVEFTIKKQGIGAGKRDYKTAGVLRALLLEES